MGFRASDVPDLKGRCYLVTGANSGIGLETTRVLAERGARVLMGCRSEARAHAAMDQLRAEQAQAQLEFIPLDLADLDSVRRAAALVQERTDRLDALVNNAGIMMVPKGQTTQGFELQFGVNHLGPYLLTELLLPLLDQHPGSRVVLTSSWGHWLGRIDFEDLQAERSYSKTWRYCASKLANLVHLSILERRLKVSGSSTLALGVHPGAADTELTRHLPKPIAWLGGPFLRIFLNSAPRGAWPTLMACTATGLQSGDYLGPRWLYRGAAVHARRRQAARDPGLAERLDTVSRGLVGLD